MEQTVLDFIQQTMQSPLFDRFWPVITHLGDAGAIWIILTLALLVHPRTRRLGLACGIALLCSVVFTNLILKNLVARTRPFYLVDIELLIKAPGEHSFPSGHATSSFAVAFVLWKERTRIGRMEIYRIGMVLASLIAFSRLYLYVHYPTDVLAGVLMGYLCSVVAFKTGPLLMGWLNRTFGVKG
jgi:undecaprenyl-diphosphatase